MVKPLPTMDAEMFETFRKNEAKQRLSNTRVGCLLVVFLMPAGSALDYFVYPDKLGLFFCLRLYYVPPLPPPSSRSCSPIPPRNGASRWASRCRCSRSFPSAGMIALTDGFGSPYYAGLNLVLIAVGSVLNWTVWESLFAVSVTLAIYVAAGFVSAWHERMPPTGVVFNNFYFPLPGGHHRHRGHLRAGAAAIARIQPAV